VSLPAVLLRERRAFCETLDEVGPDGPCLCEGWTAADVAAHVQATESLAGVPVLTAYATGVAVITTFTKLRPWAQGQFTQVMEREKARGFDTVVARLRNGPPLILRFPLVGDVRLCEEWVTTRTFGGQRRCSGAALGPRAGVASVAHGRS
jgi:hypothetical protein